MLNLLVVLVDDRTEDWLPSVICPSIFFLDEKLLEDPSPSVRVAAAEALYVLGDKKTGFEGLIDTLKETEDPVVSLEALNITQALGVMNNVPEDVWARACKAGGYSKRMAKDQDDPNLQR